LLPLAGEPLIRQTLRRALSSSLDPVILVVGHEADEVRASVAGLPVDCVFNPDAAAGQSTSVRAGLAVLSPDVEAAVFILGDQPGVNSNVIETLITAWQDSRAPVVAPRYEDRMGNPVLFDQRVFPQLNLLEGDVGARSIVRACQDSGELQLVPVAGPAPPDVDTEADYAALIATWPRPATERPLLPAHTAGSPRSGWRSRSEGMSGSES